MNLDLKTIRNTLNTYKHKKIAISAAVFIILICIFFFYLGIQTPETTSDNITRQSFPERVSQGLDNLRSTIGIGPKRIVQTLPSPTPTININEIIEKSPQTADEIIKYTTGQYREDGFYNYISHYEESCYYVDGEKRCPFNNSQMFQTTNAWTALAYIASYSITKNPQHLELAKRDLDALMVYCATDPQACRWILIQYARLYEVTNDPRYKDFLIRQGELVLSSTESNPMLMDIEIRELVIIYDLTKENRYLDAAENRWTTTQSLWNKRVIAYTTKNPKSDQMLLIPNTVCWNTLAQLELYRATNKPTYLQNVQMLLVDGHVSEMIFQFQNPVGIEPCIESFFLLSKATNDERYRDTAAKLLYQFSAKYYDSPAHSILYGEGGVVFNPNFKTKGVDKTKIVVLTDADYYLYLLSLL